MRQHAEESVTSAIGEGRSVVWPESKECGTAIWPDNHLGGPPLRCGPLPQGRKNRVYTEKKRNAVVSYAVYLILRKAVFMFFPRRIKGGGDFFKQEG
ncbi:MAG: hypothetical protein OXF02_00350 [Simkaniaceae bacterium]|nr:hypothetical protein [Simkaniaceae bacterium]